MKFTKRFSNKPKILRSIKRGYENQTGYIPHFHAIRINFQFFSVDPWPKEPFAVPCFNYFYIGNIMYSSPLFRSVFIILFSMALSPSRGLEADHGAGISNGSKSVIAELPGELSPIVLLDVDTIHWNVSTASGTTHHQRRYRSRSLSSCNTGKDPQNL